jgi:hypothetical protein
MSRIAYFDKYYVALGLEPGAGNAQIKAAYRSLAKRYHPDRSGSESTRSAFIAVNEAYQVLIHRDAYITEAQRRLRNREAKARTTTPPPPDEIRRKAASYADMRFEAFAKTPIYRTAMVLNRMFDYVYIGVGVLMVAAPAIGYFAEFENATRRGEEPEFHVLPMIFGICFLYGLWYFHFRNPDE